MNQIEKNKKYQIRSEDDLPVAYNSALYITNRQVSWLIASLILLSFFIFIAGYFLGQRKMSESQIAVSPLNTITSAQPVQVATTTILHEQNMHNAFQEELSNEQLYKAQLIGFGTLRAAHQFVERLQQKNMPVRVQERHSKTAQGKEVIWYQVTTELFNDKQELTAFVERIKKEERLKDIRIVSC